MSARRSPNTKMCIPRVSTQAHTPPKTKQFTHYGVAGTYGNVIGLNGDQWFTVFREADSPIARVSKDEKVSRLLHPAEREMSLTP